MKKNALESTLDTVKTFANNTANDISTRANTALGQMGVAYDEFQKNIPFYQQEINNTLSKIIPTTPFVSVGDRTLAGQKQQQDYSKQSPIDKLSSGTQNPENSDVNMGPVFTDYSSAKFTPQMALPPANPALEDFKKAVIQGGGFRPEAQRYFSGIPIVVDPNMPEGIAGQATFTPFQQNPNEYASSWNDQTYFDTRGGGPTYISVRSPDIGNPKFSQWAIPALLHELIHTAPRVNNQQAMQAFQSINAQNNPFLNEIGNGYTWGNNPPPNPEEFFATTAEQLGPSVVNDPTVGQYYSHIFENPGTVNPMVVEPHNLPKGTTASKLKIANKKGR